MLLHRHRTHRSGWLRAGVLGANDGLLSISSLLLGVSAAHMGSGEMRIAGLAGLIGGALSMGAGEYVSVSSQADAEQADLAMERDALRADFDAEHAELRDIYVRRGVSAALAAQVARELMAHDALGAHARDDIGITGELAARPLQAAAASAASFLAGGLPPLLVSLVAPDSLRMAVMISVTLVFLAVLGAAAARTGGASMLRGAWRVLIWGAVVMSATTTLGFALRTPL